VHHIVCAFQQTAALTGTTLGMYLQLSDGATNQCCIVFRSDGAILLTSATPARDRAGDLHRRGNAC
jgi:hypothetical protein